MFSGCGGFDLGLLQNNFKGIAAYDINNAVISVYNKNVDKVGEVRDLLQDFDCPIYPDVIISGAPCQGFSTAGKRKLDDPRNYLFIRSIEIALKLKPKVFVAENVAGILSGKHKIHYMDYAIQRLSTSGYKTHLFTIDCRELGMAQRRKRAILIAWNTDRDLVFSRNSYAAQNIRNVISNIPGRIANNDTTACAAVGKHLLIATHIKPGQKLSNVRNGNRSVHTWHIPTVFGKVTRKEVLVLEGIMFVRRRIRKRDWGDADPVSIKDLKAHLKFDPSVEVNSLIEKQYIKRIARHIDLTHTYNGKYRRLHWDEPSLTVDTRFGSPLLFLHPTENRAYTVREAARLQGFPDEFVFDGSLHAQYEMIGNAVPPPLASYLAKTIEKLL